jgi:hypothetical protein
MLAAGAIAKQVYEEHNINISDFLVFDKNETRIQNCLKLIPFAKIRSNDGKIAEDELLLAIVNAVDAFQQLSMSRNDLLRFSTSISATPSYEKKKSIKKQSLTAGMSSPVPIVQLKVADTEK